MVKTREQIQEQESPEIANLKEQIRLLNNALRDQKLAQGKLAGVLDQILKNVTVCDPVKIEYKKSKSKKLSHHLCSAVLHFTDWHIGRRVETVTVNNFNEYNYDIATKRVEYIVGAIIDEIENERRIFRIEELVIMVTGDMINGALRNGDIATNEFPLCVQPVKAAELIANAIVALASRFLRIRVEWVVPDNHSRIEKKIDWAEPWNSMNYIVAELVKAKTCMQENITVNIHPGTVGEVQVQNMKYLIRHGHGMTKSGGSFSGIPFYNIDRYIAQETVARMGLGEDYRFDKVLIGHFHVEYNAKLARISNSLSGTDNFDRSLGRLGVPGQSGWIVHPKYGEKNYNLYEVGSIV